MRLFLVIAKRLGSGGGVEDTSSYNTCIRHDVSIDIAISYAIFPPPCDIKRRGKDLPRDRHNRITTKMESYEIKDVAKILRGKWRRVVDKKEEWCWERDADVQAPHSIVEYSSKTNE